MEIKRSKAPKQSEMLELMSAHVPRRTASRERRFMPVE
jgi:hypothetical protein